MPQQIREIFPELAIRFFSRHAAIVFCRGAFRPISPGPQVAVFFLPFATKKHHSLLRFTRSPRFAFQFFLSRSAPCYFVALQGAFFSRLQCGRFFLRWFALQTQPSSPHFFPGRPQFFKGRCLAGFSSGVQCFVLPGYLTPTMGAENILQVIYDHNQITPFSLSCQHKQCPIPPK